MPQMPMGSPCLLGANHGEMAGMPMVPMMPMPAPSRTRLAMNSGSDVENAPMTPPTMLRHSAAMTIFLMPNLLARPAVGNDMTNPST